MNKEEFIAKWGIERYKEKLNRDNERARDKRGFVKEPTYCFSFTFTTPLPENEEGLVKWEFNNFLLLRGNELAYHFKRILAMRYRNRYNTDCIVIVEPKVDNRKKNFKFKAELYGKIMNPEVEEWFREEILNLDYE